MICICLIRLEQNLHLPPSVVIEIAVYGGDKLYKDTFSSCVFIIYHCLVYSKSILVDVNLESLDTYYTLT